MPASPSRAGLTGRRPRSRSLPPKSQTGTRRATRCCAARSAPGRGKQASIRCYSRAYGKSTRAIELTEDLRLSMALKLLNPAMPLIVRGNILTPAWLLDHPQEGYELITGPAPDFLRRIDPEDWLSPLKKRVETVRARARQLDIAFNEEDLRVYLLSTSIPRLAAMWEERRKLLPDTEHPGLASLMDRRQTAEEDLILLLGASIGQFRSAAEVIEEATKEASSAGIRNFTPADAEVWFGRPRREHLSQRRRTHQEFLSLWHCGGR